MEPGVKLYVGRMGPGQEVPESLKVYHRHRTDYTVEAGSVLRGMRVVIPEKHRAQVLGELHAGHPGMVKMKGIALSRVWWPGIDQDIETMVHNCSACQETRNQPPPSPLHSWPWPSTPWERIHVDFAGPFMGSMFLHCRGCLFQMVRSR